MNILIYNDFLIGSAERKTAYEIVRGRTRQEAVRFYGGGALLTAEGEPNRLQVYRS